MWNQWDGSAFGMYIRESIDVPGEEMVSGERAELGGPAAAFRSRGNALW